MPPSDSSHPLWKIIEAREATIRKLRQQLEPGSHPLAAPASVPQSVDAPVPAGTNMHSQEVEFELLNRLIPHLRQRTFLDIGAEQGSLSRFFIAAGLTGHLFEPYARHATGLSALVAGTDNVFHPLAVDDSDHPAELQIATDASGAVMAEFNSLHKLDLADQRISQTTVQPVACRSLRSLIADGSIPPTAGLVKTDTEGNDAAVLRGMPADYCEALCCEYFTEGLYAGWEQSHPRVILALARQLGFEHYIVTKRRAGLTLLALGPTTFAPLTWGNFIFVRAGLWKTCLDVWLELVKKCDAEVSGTYETLVAANQKLGAEYATLQQAAGERLVLIEHLNKTGAELRSQVVATDDLRAKLAQVHAASQQQQEQLQAKEAMIGELKQGCVERDDLIQLLAKDGPNKDWIQLPKRPSLLTLQWRRLRRHVLDKMAKSSPYPLGALEQSEPRPVVYDRLPRPAPRADWPRICLITPSYQQGHFLERTMRSVVEQGYPKLAYGVQDGGSTDGSAELINRFLPQLAHAESAPDNGQAAAIQRGFEKLYPEDGDIMGWLNSDDILCPGTLAYVGDYFHRHPDVDVIYGHRIIIDDEDREIGRWFLPRHHKGTLRWVDLVPQETLFWRARCYRQINGIDPSFQFAMDWDLLLRLEEAGFNLRRLPHFLGCFRVHTHQKTSVKITTVGEQEMQRLRLRTHGHEVPHWEIQKHLSEEIRRGALVAWLHRHGLRF
jgi:FkbM family methyltransferase